MLSLFLAKRFFKNSDKNAGGVRKASPPALRIATAGIAVGLAVMVVSICFVRGFQHEVSGKIAGFTSHIEVIEPNSLSSPESFPVVTDEKLINQVKQTPGVESVQRFSQKMGIFKTQSDFAGVLLKGVAGEYDLNFIKHYMVSGHLPHFSDSETKNEIVISQTIANKLKLSVGDKVYSYYFSNTIKQRRFKVVGIYNTYMKQFDNNVVLADMYAVNQLNRWLPEQSSGLEIRLGSYDDLDKVQYILAKKVGGHTDRFKRSYAVLSVKDNPVTSSVLSWLNLLDLNVMVILVIMICVAGFTMVSGLLILILERTQTIGVLKALGATNNRIRHTFLWYAAFIIGRGMLWGNVIGISVVMLQKYTHVVSLDPEVYYVPYAPVDFDVLSIVVLNVITLLVTMLALVIPSYLVSHIQPAKAIQFD